MTLCKTRKSFTNIGIQEVLRRRRQVAIVWSIEDVQSVRPDLDNHQAWEVLQECERRHDCERGFNWPLIEFIADDLFPNPINHNQE